MTEFVGNKDFDIACTGELARSKLVDARQLIGVREGLVEIAFVPRA